MIAKLKNWLWKWGILELPFWEQPEVPMVGGEPLRAALAARNFGKVSPC